MKRCLLAFVCLPLTALLIGCGESHILPMRPLQRVQMWVPDGGAKAFPISPPTNIVPESDGGLQHITILAEEAAATRPDADLPPGHEITKIIDPNQTSRYVYNASYDNVWQQALLIAAQTGFTVDRKDYRQGVISTRSLPSAQLIEFWKPQQTNFNNALENTINSQRRYLRITINTVPGHPKFYEIGVQVLVERETNPTELLSGPLFIEGSGFGRNAITLRSDYADATTAMPPKKAGAIEQTDPHRRWVLLGHDPDLEKKILNALFERI
ncbi:MAG: hypothetical protein FWD53_00310 [Phycisphaerales bacterium]|nr:hypothetical protein [Phycisphaerales bacterium]